MIVMDWIKKLTDIIMPLEPPNEEEEEVKETKKAEAKAEQPLNQTAQAAQPGAQVFQAEKQAAASDFSQNFASGITSFTRNGGMVSTAENGVTSMGGVRALPSSKPQRSQ